ncbi:hypothetical protein CkaCkLH20_00299 [Colletotrichum karsti]|uniref:Nitroreductase domain-containing protein n=1 Tax=Colletotrichum karsti TaxID=1095194 RepID=A0A9P6IEZ4_9PEZI|nr:uncharacterized protein CkaCkLH20_00299 [Colletotrichum karsti]KAF9882263.1 hypothetical protein CkaCkLH20_00299 [Colletotrichum karsti]
MAEDKLGLLQQRYGSPPGDALTSSPWSPTLSLILNHTSVRYYLPDALPAGTLEALIAAGQSASSSSMLQTWSAIAITDPAHKDKVADLAGDQPFIRQAPLFILFCADLSRLSESSERLHKPAQGLEKLDPFLMASIDAALAAQNMAIAAESLGLGMCYIGAARNNARQLTDLLKLPPRVVGLFGMTVGKPDSNSLNCIKPRLPLNEVLHREVWDNEGREEKISEYDQILGSFYEGQKKHNRKPWSEHIALCVETDDLDGRELFRGVLDDQKLSVS